MIWLTERCVIAALYWPEKPLDLKRMKNLLARWKPRDHQTQFKQPEFAQHQQCHTSLLQCDLVHEQLSQASSQDYEIFKFSDALNFGIS